MYPKSGWPNMAKDSEDRWLFDDKLEIIFLISP